ncbi:membrane protease FtsH catalytic subunit [Tamaricihabitans halophyticus]|uniref:ATP-dependent zinc metalloprotease FtsH n=1 Tax=Tamaricihabitans halophyticus TaxID=1262583 RepID=A0A4R2R2G5_9PSEU|nr:ATP-dependent zinc metalloprotease FtsH [Tamaricihabitans halophyticus]TCP56733.1 membrane protease FtsH catalytic subunit [Tamaricihabitans halophyticus]
MDRKRLLRNPVVWILAVVLLYLVFSTLFDDTRGYNEVSTSKAVAQVQAGNVESAEFEDKEQRLKLTLNNPVQGLGEGSTKLITQFPAQAAGEIYNSLQNNNIEFDTKVTQDSFLTQMLIYMIPLGLLLLLLFWMMNNAQGGGNRVMNFGKSKAKQLNKDMPTTMFTDVAGADEAVEELHEIKDFLQSPGRYQALGAKIPKGVLLYGPPGTGKTLLARAVAGEAGVPFYTISGSDFVEMFVGVGASRVRDLFEQAKQNAPCIIFVDEIDAVGRQRGAGLGGGHDEREQTLNQLLVEMDGFDSRGGIILIAATNRPDILDPALLRPGRFDRQIPVSAPDMRGRKAILQVHAKGKPFARDVSLDGLAKRTVGMSGADLENVINEAALLTARQNQQTITEAALEESVDRVIGGPARKSRIISEHEKKITAYHEGGHALAAWAMPDLEPVYKLTILPRGRTGGHALVVPEDDKELMTRSEMIARLVFALGGRSAEELVFHEPTTGASSDIEQATKIARAMVTEYGMSARLGAVKYGQEQGDPFLGRSAGRQSDYSLEVAHEIDEEVRKLIEAAHTEAWDVLNTYRDVLDDLVVQLLQKETLQRKDLEEIFSRVEKRPRITTFNEFGERTPSDKPPVKTPRELAHERGEPWPEPAPEAPQQETPQPETPQQETPEPVGAATQMFDSGQQSGQLDQGQPVGNGLGSNGQAGRHAAYPEQPTQGYPQQGYPQGGPVQGGPVQGGPAQGGPVQGGYPQSASPNRAGPPHYGAPPGWQPATTPRGRNQQWAPQWEQSGNEYGQREGTDGTYRSAPEQSTQYRSGEPGTDHPEPGNQDDRGQRPPEDGERR